MNEMMKCCLICQYYANPYCIPQSDKKLLRVVPHYVCTDFELISFARLKRRVRDKLDKEVVDVF
jgi:hypothetical protein